MEPIPSPNDCDHMTATDFKEAVDYGMFVDDDGSGYYATETEMSRERANPSDVRLLGLKKGYTHVVWFNK